MLGKLYLCGRDVSRDREKAVEYLTASAEQGNLYASSVSYTHLFHMEKRDTDLQGELNDTVQKLYEKYVPQATREYIDDKVAREISTRERTRRADRTVRREESQLEESEIV